NWGRAGARETGERSAARRGALAQRVAGPVRQRRLVQCAQRGRGVGATLQPLDGIHHPREAAVAPFMRVAVPLDQPLASCDLDGKYGIGGGGGFDALEPALDLRILALVAQRGTAP